MSFNISRKRVCHQVQPQAALQQQQLRDTIVSEEMEHAVHGMTDAAVAMRPINTTRNYRAKQVQFSAWCLDKKFDTGDIVDANKLAFFIYDYVLPRNALDAPVPEPESKPKRARGRKRKADEEQLNEKEPDLIDLHADMDDAELMRGMAAEVADTSDIIAAQNDALRRTQQLPAVAEVTDDMMFEVHESDKKRETFKKKLNQVAQTVEAGSASSQSSAATATPNEAIVLREREVRARIWNSVIRHKGVDTWVCAIIDLWTIQSNKGINQNAHPRMGPVKALTHAVRRMQRARDIYNHVDPGRGGIMDGFTSHQEQRDFFDYFMYESNSPAGVRDAFLCAIGMAGMMRSDEYTQTRLMDWGMYEMEVGSTATPFRVFYATLNHGKHNQFGKTEYASMLRHRDVRACPVAMLALHLFIRFHHVGETFEHSDDNFPSMARREHWYKEYMTPAPRNSQEPLSYHTHLEGVTKALDYAQVATLQKTHLMRKTGARRAETAGCTEAQMSKHGRWKNGVQVMENVYLTHMSRSVLQAMAGFSPDMHTDYYLPRAVAVPDNLQRKVFPQLDSRLRLFENPAHACQDLQGRNFVLMMKELRSVFLQDAPHLRRAYPELFIWGEPFFHTHEYRNWEKHALDLTESGAAQHTNSTLEQLEPAIADALRSLRSGQRADLANLLHGQAHLSLNLDKVAQATGELNYKQDGHATVLQALHALVLKYNSDIRAVMRNFSKACADAFEPIDISIPTSLPLSTTPIQSPPSTIPTDLRAPLSDTHHHQPLPSRLRSLSNPNSTLAAANAVASQAASATTIGSATGTASTHPPHPLTVSPSVPSPPTTDILVRGLKNVRVLWQEYTVGLQGRPPTSTVYDNGVRTEFPSQNERRFWFDRRTIIETIKDIHKHHQRSLEESVALMERLRQKKGPKKDGLSLKQLAILLRKEGKEGSRKLALDCL